MTKDELWDERILPIEGVGKFAVASTPALRVRVPAPHVLPPAIRERFREFSAKIIEGPPGEKVNMLITSELCEENEAIAIIQKLIDRWSNNGR